MSSMAPRCAPAQSSGRSKSRNRQSCTDVDSLTLGCPVGLKQGTFNQNEMKVDTSDTALLAICTCCYAYAHTYIRPPCRWSGQTINDIVVGGAGHLRAAQPLDPHSGETSIIDGRPFQVDDYSVQLAASNPFPQLIGNLLPCNRPTAGPSLRQGLRQFFRPQRLRDPRRPVGCLFRCQHVILLLWRADQVYYVFDASGRNEQCQPDAQHGVASLICVEQLRNVSCLLLRMSGLQMDALYALSELRVAKLQPNGGGTAQAKADAAAAEAAAARPPCRGYELVDEQTAILRGSLAVSNACFTTTRNRQALIVCCIAYVYSLVRPPNAWTSRSVDQVLLFGNKLYAECCPAAALAACGGGGADEVFSVRDIPPMIVMGAFRAALCIVPFVEGGRLTHSVDALTSELQRALRQFFDEQPSSRRRRCALVQADQLSFAVWRRDDAFYLFDARNGSRRGGGGGGSGGSAACLRMYSTLEGLTAELYEIVMCVAEKELFYVHGVWATVTDNRRPATAGCSEDEVSLNESVDLVPVPPMLCVGDEGSSGVNRMDVECNLDSPSVSATQFMRPWHMVKAEVFAPLEENGELAATAGSDKGKKSHGGSDDDLDDDSDDEDDDTPANNDLGLSNDEYDRLRAAGLSDEEIREYLLLGLSADEALRWFQEGVSPSQVARLKACGITDVDDFVNNYRKYDLNIDDCERLFEMQIPVKMFARMKAAGLDPDEMALIMADENAKKRFRESGLNQCQMEKLMAAGVTAEMFELAAREGLSYDEMMHAIKHGIPLEEFARLKDMGMSSVDIVRAQEMGIDPETLMKMKELGLQPEEMQRALELGLTPEEYAALRENGTVDEAALQAFADNKKAEAAIAAGEEISKELANGDVDEKEKDTIDEPRAGKTRPDICDDNAVEYCGDWSDTECVPSDKTQRRDRICRDSSSEVELDNTCLDENRRQEQKALIMPKHDISVIKSAACTPSSIRKLLNASFKIVDRVLVLDTNNQPTCVAFIDTHSSGTPEQPLFFLCEDCHEDLKSIRRIDVDEVQSRLTTFCSLDNMIERIIQLLQQAALRSEMQMSVQYAQDLLDEHLAAINARLDKLLTQFRQLNGDPAALCS